MSVSARNSLSLCLIYFLIVFSGFSTLSWEVIWQIKSTLALGVSAWGAAITLAVTMGGMCVGSLLMGRALHEGANIPAVRLYAVLEITVGLSGLFLNGAFRIVEKLDTLVFATFPGSATFIHILGIAFVLGIPTACMGATLPVFGLIAKHFQTSIAKMYGVNTLGAASGALLTALMLIPVFGITGAIYCICVLNVLIGVSAWLFIPAAHVPVDHRNKLNEAAQQMPSFQESFVVFVTGFSTFTLEIAWFRSLSSTYQETADAFAIMLACMLVALGVAAKDVPKLKLKKIPLGVIIVLAGVLILLVTPLVERFDLFVLQFQANDTGQANPTASPLAGLLNHHTYVLSWRATFLYLYQMVGLAVVTFCLIGPPVVFLGVAFPWILDEQNSSRRMGRLYALNTFAAIVGAIGAAWLLLPTIGFARTAWIAGSLVVVAGVLITPRPKRVMWSGLGLGALLIAVHFEAGIGKVRAQGYFANPQGKPAKVLEFFEGPEATVSVVEYDTGARRLLINSTSATGQSSYTETVGAHYMPWMGHLPMLLSANPENALVICFGTGQTANALRNEGPNSLDIVDINPRIFKLAHNFKSNEDVLKDPKVKAIAMDGRAYLRRSQKQYDVISLEPMPPTAAGVNALYSKEFYELARKRLGSSGVIAQWLPFHMVTPYYSASIARTFAEVFPNAILWIDPISVGNGILLGSTDDGAELGTAWPGFARNNIVRDLSLAQVEENVALNSAQLKEYGAYGQIITDDNQLLAYGKAQYADQALYLQNFELLHRINSKIKELQNLAI